MSQTGQKRTLLDYSLICCKFTHPLNSREERHGAKVEKRLRAIRKALPPELPFAALLTGCVTLLRNWNRGPDRQQAARQPSAAIRTDSATRIVTAATLSAAAVLVVVAVHMLAN